RLEQAFLAGAVAVEMHVTVDQPGQHEALAQIDHLRAGMTLRTDEAIAHGFHLAVSNDDGGIASWRLARTIEQPSGLDEYDTFGLRLCWRRHRPARQECNRYRLADSVRGHRRSSSSLV